MLDGTTASNAATFYLVFTPWEERTDASLSQDAILGGLRHRLGELQDGITFVFPPPSIRGLGVTGGFQIQLEDRGGVGLPALQQLVQEMIQDGSTQTALRALNSSFRAGVPQLFADVDRDKVKQLGIPLNSVFSTLQIYLGSQYVNDFNKFGRTYQVIAQADAPYRANADNIAQLKVRNVRGEMVPLGSVLTMKQSYGPDQVTHYNGYPAADISGSTAP